MEGFELSEVSTSDRGKTGNSQSHPSLVSSLEFTTTRSEMKLFKYMLANCRLCIAHKKTTNMEQRV